MARRFTLALLTATIGAAAALMGGWPGPYWRQWDRAFEDQAQGLLGRRTPPDGVVTVAIDEATLQQGDWFARQGDRPSWAQGIGSLPWPRAAYGQVAERLLRQGAAVVAINVTFTGPSSHGPQDDRAMEAILRRHPGRVVLAAEMSEGDDARGAGSLTLVRPEPFMALPGVGEAIGLSNMPLRLPGEPLRHPEAYAGGLVRAQGVEAPPSLPLAILLLRAALADLPPDLEDAARLEGLGPLQRLRFVLLPLLALQPAHSPTFAKHPRQLRRQRNAWSRINARRIVRGNFFGSMVNSLLLRGRAALGAAKTKPSASPSERSLAPPSVRPSL
jgi:CHASE2 domain-containing sensor protein